MKWWKYLVVFCSTPLMAAPPSAVQVGGKLEFDFVATELDEGTENASPHFELNKLVLGLRAHPHKDIRFHTELEFETDGARPDEYAVKFLGLPLNGTVALGLDDRFFKPKRFTERYPLTVTAFSRDEEIGLTWTSDYQSYYFIGYLAQGLELKLKQTGVDKSFRMLHDDTLKDSTGLRVYGGGFGLRYGGLDAMIWALRGLMTSADTNELKAAMPGYDVDFSRQYRVGINSTWTAGAFNLTLQGVNARDGALDRWGGFLQPSFDFHLGGQIFARHRLLARAGFLKVNYPNTFSAPATWDRGELTLAAISYIVSSFKLKTEFTFASEETGGRPIDNNELQVQFNYEF